MKSIDYLECGIPIINNLQGDLHRIVENENCGVNVGSDGWIDKILTSSITSEMRIRAYESYEKHFDIKSFERKLSTVLESVCGSCEGNNIYD
jgi:hypothetical protein